MLVYDETEFRGIAAPASIRPSSAEAFVTLLFIGFRVVTWFDHMISRRLRGWSGYAFAALYGAFATVVVVTAFGGTPVPRFTDIFLVGIVVTAYAFNWRPALLLFLYAQLFSVSLLAPQGGLEFSHPPNLFRLGSFAASSLFLVFFIERARSSRILTESDSSSH